MKKILINLVLILSLISQITLYADDSADISNNEREKSGEKTRGFVPFALPFYSPESGVGAGGTVIFYSRDGYGSKTDETQVYGAVTWKKQMAIGIMTDRYFLGDDLKLNGNVEADRWPDTFWGIGPETKDDMEEDYTDRTMYVHLGLMWKIKSMFYLGPLYRYRYVKMTETEENGILDNDTVKGSDGAVTTGPGIQLIWDERDSNFYPHKGFLFEVIFSTYLEALGSEFDFYKFEINHRQFINLYRDHVLAFQVQLQHSKGTLPFQSLYKMGGENMMRGIYNGRYRDKNHAAMQVEYRFPVIWRFGGVLFSSIAEVAPTVMDFNVDNLVYSWGGGLRFTADKKEHINFRLDFGFNSNFDPSVYLTAKEAF